MMYALYDVGRGYVRVKSYGEHDIVQEPEQATLYQKFKTAENRRTRIMLRATRIFMNAGQGPVPTIEIHEIEFTPRIVSIK